MSTLVAGENNWSHETHLVVVFVSPQWTYNYYHISPTVSGCGYCSIRVHSCLYPSLLMSSLYFSLSFLNFSPCFFCLAARSHFSISLCLYLPLMNLFSSHPIFIFPPSPCFVFPVLFSLLSLSRLELEQKCLNTESLLRSHQPGWQASVTQTHTHLWLTLKLWMKLFDLCC